MIKPMAMVALACVALITTGCAAIPSTKSSNEPTALVADLTADFNRSRLIAADFASTLTQIPETNPEGTILHTSRPSTRFGELLLTALQTAGFDLRIGSPSSDFWLSYSADRDAQSSADGNPVYTFVVAAGEVNLKRSYKVDRYSVRPTGSMFVRGGTTDNVVLDDSIFNVVQEKELMAAVPENTVTGIERNTGGSSLLPNKFADTNQLVEIAAVPTPKPFVKTRKVVAQKSTVENNRIEKMASTSVISSGLVSSEKLDSAQVAQNNTVSVAKPADTKQAGELFSKFSNMYDTRESRYQEVFKAYGVIDERVMIFPNDSLVMGRINKESVKRFVSDFDETTDVFSVIGCSHGSSSVEGGNGYLANSRAFRVKEEFIAAGVLADKVMEEGCWASVAHQKMPARGVVVRHKRLLVQ